MFHCASLLNSVQCDRVSSKQLAELRRPGNAYMESSLEFDSAQADTNSPTVA